MKISTLDRRIVRQKPITLPRDIVRWLDEIEEEALQSYVESMEPALRGLDFTLLGLQVCGTVAVLMWTERAEVLNFSGMDRRTIATELISAVMREAVSC